MSDKVRWSKVARRLWNDEKFRSLSAPPPNGQTLWLRLLTGPELGVIPGVFQAWEAGLAQSLGWDLAPFREGWREVSGKGLAKADWRVGFVWVPKAPEYNRPESPNVILSWRTTWDDLPECSLKHEVWQALRAFAEGWGPSFAKAFGQACRHPSPNQEQEQEQEQEISPSASLRESAPVRAHARVEESGFQLAPPEPSPSKPAPKAKPPKPQPSTPAAETDEQALWRVFRELRARQYEPGVYAATTRDGRAVRHIAQQAAAKLADRLTRYPDADRVAEREALYRHWVERYFDGRSEWLSANGHPLHALGDQLPALADPESWSRPPRPRPPSPSPVSADSVSGIRIAARVASVDADCGAVEGSRTHRDAPDGSQAIPAPENASRRVS